MTRRTALPYVCILQLLLPAQTPPGVPVPAPANRTGTTTAQPTPPVLRVTTRLVQINVVVHDKKDAPVADLKKEDFEIYDDGVKQQVATFSVESSQPPPAQVAAAKPKVTLPPNTFTNRTELRPAAPSAATVLLLDGLNTAFEDQAYARKQLINLIQQIHPEDRVALYVLGRELKVLHDFTSDSTSLLRAVAKYKGRAAVELADSLPEDPNTGDDDLDQFLSDADHKIADFQVMNRVDTTLKAIEAIANHVSRLPGRKNLIWISGGFPFSIGMDAMDQPDSSDAAAMSRIDTRERRTFSDELEHAARAVNQAGMAIYPVDARGLVAMPDFAASTGPQKNIRRPPPGPANSKAMNNLQKTHDTMEIIAQRTGGKAYYNSNDLKTAMRRAMDDSRVTYMVGYYPAHNTWDGKFHEVKVKVDRPGVNVRNRLGYFAFADQPVTEKDRRAGLMEAAWSALDATTLGLTVRLGPNIPKPGILRAVMLLDIRSVKLEQKDDRWTGLLDILFVQQSSSDAAPKITNDTVQLNLTKEHYLDGLKRGFLIGKDLNLADTAYMLRVAVRDAGSGNVGSVNIRTDRLKPEPPPATAAPAGQKAPEPKAGEQKK